MLCPRPILLRRRPLVVFWLIPALLLALGLRLCLHVPHAADDTHTHTTAIHLESHLASPTDTDDANDSHVSLAFALFKFGEFLDGLAVTAVLAAALLLFLPRQTPPVPAPVGAVPALPGGHRFRPPLRAPPR
jgi:hypothetical protein